MKSIPSQLLRRNTTASSVLLTLIGLALPPAFAVDITGDTVTTDLTVNGNTTGTGWALFKQGVDFGNNGEASLNWWPGTSPAGTVTFDINWADGTFTWRDDVTTTTAINKMSLDAANTLTLFRANGTAGITFAPETGRITLPAGNGTTTGSGIYFGNSTTAAISASSTGTPVFSGNATFAGGIAITSNTASTSSSTGALTVAGGLGIARDAWINGVRIGRGNGSVNDNTALGERVLESNTTGGKNTAAGSQSLMRHRTGFHNSAYGHATLHFLVGGVNNSAFGTYSLYATTSSNNTAYGCYSLFRKATGSGNTALGYAAGNFQADGTDLTSATNSIFIGSNSRSAANGNSNSIVIGTNAVGYGTNTTVIGNTSTTRTHLHGQTTTTSLEVSGNTSLKGQVTLEQPQGDISMGIYQ